MEKIDNDQVEHNMVWDVNGKCPACGSGMQRNAKIIFCVNPNCTYFEIAEVAEYG